MTRNLAQDVLATLADDFVIPSVPPPSFVSTLCFGLLFAAYRVTSGVLRSRPAEPRAVLEYLATLGLLDRDANGEPIASARVGKLLRPHLSEGFVEKPQLCDIVLLFAVVLVSAEADATGHELRPDAASFPGWLPAVVTEAVGRANAVPADALDRAMRR